MNTNKVDSRAQILEIHQTVQIPNKDQLVIKDKKPLHAVTKADELLAFFVEAGICDKYGVILPPYDTAEFPELDRKTFEKFYEAINEDLGHEWRIILKNGSKSKPLDLLRVLKSLTKAESSHYVGSRALYHVAQVVVKIAAISFKIEESKIKDLFELKAIPQGVDKDFRIFVDGKETTPYELHQKCIDVFCEMGNLQKETLIKEGLKQNLTIFGDAGSFSILSPQASDVFDLFISEKEKLAKGGANSTRSGILIGISTDDQKPHELSCSHFKPGQLCLDLLLGNFTPIPVDLMDETTLLELARVMVKGGVRVLNPGTTKLMAEAFFASKNRVMREKLIREERQNKNGDQVKEKMPSSSLENDDPEFILTCLKACAKGHFQGDQQSGMLVFFTLCQLLQKAGKQSDIEIGLLVEHFLKSEEGKKSEELLLGNETKRNDLCSWLRKALLVEKRNFSEISKMLQAAAFILYPSGLVNHEGDIALMMPLNTQNGLYHLHLPFNPSDAFALIDEKNAEAFAALCKLLMKSHSPDKTYRLSKASLQVPNDVADMALKWVNDKDSTVALRGLLLYLSCPDAILNKEKIIYFVKQFPRILNLSFFRVVKDEEQKLLLTVLGRLEGAIRCRLPNDRSISLCEGLYQDLDKNLQLPSLKDWIVRLLNSHDSDYCQLAHSLLIENEQTLNFVEFEVIFKVLLQQSQLVDATALLKRRVANSKGAQKENRDLFVALAEACAKKPKEVERVSTLLKEIALILLTALGEKNETENKTEQATKPKKERGKTSGKTKSIPVKTTSGNSTSPKNNVQQERLFPPFPFDFLKVLNGLATTQKDLAPVLDFEELTQRLYALQLQYDICNEKPWLAIFQEALENKAPPASIVTMLSQAIKTGLLDEGSHEVKSFKVRLASRLLAENNKQSLLLAEELVAPFLLEDSALLSMKELEPFIDRWLAKALDDYPTSQWAIYLLRKRLSADSLWHIEKAKALLNQCLSNEKHSDIGGFAKVNWLLNKTATEELNLLLIKLIGLKIEKKHVQDITTDLVYYLSYVVMCRDKHKEIKEKQLESVKLNGCQLPDLPNLVDHPLLSCSSEQFAVLLEFCINQHHDVNFLSEVLPNLLVFEGIPLTLVIKGVRFLNKTIGDKGFDDRMQWLFDHADREQLKEFKQLFTSYIYRLLDGKNLESLLKAENLLASCGGQRQIVLKGGYDSNLYLLSDNLMGMTVKEQAILWGAWLSAYLEMSKNNSVSLEDVLEAYLRRGKELFPDAESMQKCLMGVIKFSSTDILDMKDNQDFLKVVDHLLSIKRFILPLLKEGKEMPCSKEISAHYSDVIKVGDEVFKSYYGLVFDKLVQLYRAERTPYDLSVRFFDMIYLMTSSQQYHNGELSSLFWKYAFLISPDDDTESIGHKHFLAGKGLFNDAVKKGCFKGAPRDQQDVLDALGLYYNGAQLSQYGNEKLIVSNPHPQIIGKLYDALLQCKPLTPYVFRKCTSLFKINDAVDIKVETKKNDLRDKRCLQLIEGCKMFPYHWREEQPLLLKELCSRVLLPVGEKYTKVNLAKKELYQKLMEAALEITQKLTEKNEDIPVLIMRDYLSMDLELIQLNLAYGNFEGKGESYRKKLEELIPHVITTAIKNENADLFHQFSGALFALLPHIKSTEKVLVKELFLKWYNTIARIEQEKMDHLFPVNSVFTMLEAIRRGLILGESEEAVCVYERIDSLDNGLLKTILTNRVDLCLKAVSHQSYLENLDKSELIDEFFQVVTHHDNVTRQELARMAWLIFSVSPVEKNEKAYQEQLELMYKFINLLKFWMEDISISSSSKIKRPKAKVQKFLKSLVHFAALPGNMLDQYDADKIGHYLALQEHLKSIL